MSDEKEKKETTENAAPAEAAKPQMPEAIKSEPKEEKKTEEKAVESPKDNKEEAGEDVVVPAKFKDLVNAIEKMSVLDLHELVKLLEKKFGVSAAVAVAAPGAGGTADAAEEKSAFNVELSDFGAQKIAVIKIVKEVLGLGLKEAKDLVDAAPSMLKEGMKKEEAEEVKKRIEEAGGKVTLK